MSTYLRSYKYSDCLDFISSGRDKSARKTENNTSIRLENNRIIVKFHFTDIGIISGDDTIQLFTGGYLTFTTKDRLNKIIDHLPFRIYQKKGVWYLWNYKTKQYIYQDGLTISPDLSVTGDKLYDEYSIALRKKIKRYAKQFIQALITGKVNKPSGGDCFYCLMRDITSNKPLGESISENDHLLSHFRENYYVPSLLSRAIEIYPISRMAMWELQDIWNNGNIPDRFIVLPQQAEKSLVKYLFSRLGLPY